jgi:O-antigen biosynthesis protein
MMHVSPNRHLGRPAVAAPGASVSVIIPVFNQVSLTLQCLASLARHTPSGIHEIIVVDDASSEPYEQALAASWPQVKVLRNAVNLGFAASCNRGAGAASGEFLLFLNNDTEALPGWLEPLAAVLATRPEVGIVAPKLIHPDRTIQHCGKVWGELDTPDSQPSHIYYREPADSPKASKSREYALVTAACILVRRAEFFHLGPFDEGYENGWEDDDLCYAFSSAGKKIWYCAESTLVHYESITLGADYRLAEIAFNRILAAREGKSSPPVSAEAETLLAPYFAMPHQELTALLDENFLKVRGRFQKNKARFFSKWGHLVHRDDFLYLDQDRVLTREAHAGQAPSPLTSLVILTFNQLDVTRQTVESIRRHTPEPHEIIFVDNGSKDGTLDWLKRLVQENPAYRLIANDSNLGFAAGCNQGIGSAQGEFLLLLNNDVVVTPGWLSGMLASFDSLAEVGIVGPVTNNISGPQKISGTCYQSPSELDSFAMSHGERFSGCRVPMRRIVGFCMLFRRELVDRIGLLDEEFGSGNYEDDDFSLRAALEGFQNLIAYDIFIHHHGSASFTGNRIDYAGAMARNREIFTRKWSAPVTEPSLALKIQRLKAVEQAEIFWQRGEPESAVEAILQQGIKFNPQERDFYLLLGEHFNAEGRPGDALDALEMLPEASRDARWGLLMGGALVAAGRHTEARGYAAAEQPSVPARAAALDLSGLIALRSGELEKAAQLFHEALQTDPHSAGPYLHLATMARDAGSLADAGTLSERAFILAPTDGRCAALYHELLKALGRREAGEALFRTMVGLYPVNRMLALYLIDLLLGQGKNGEALEIIESFLCSFPCDDGFIEACLAVRGKVGPLEVKAGQSAFSQTVSLCLITKNEAAKLAACLKSLKPLVHEIILVDTGSKDKTREIGRIFGARVFDYPWNGSFADARNESLKQAEAAWVLVMDADEVISELDYAGFREALVERAQAPAAFSITTRNYMEQVDVEKWVQNAGVYPEERGAGWTPSGKIRLFPNFLGIHFDNAVHEMVDGSVNGLRLPVLDSPVVVHHYGYLDRVKQPDKEAFYYELGVKKLAENPNDPIAICELAIQAAGVKRYEEAISLWHRALAYDPASSLVFFNLGACHFNLGSFETSRDASLKAISLKGNYREAVTNYALAELCLGNVAAAQEAVNVELARDPDYPILRIVQGICHCCAGDPVQGAARFREQRLCNVEFSGFLHLVLDRLLAGGQSGFAGLLIDTAQTCGCLEEKSAAL